ncbi:hypothetical protein WMC59_11285 [Staphylococcus delphini]|uniref:hypothetical protein n=1 Tax=Staphylococcus delphini TaxID=53344 RepID=UPI00374F82B3
MTISKHERNRISELEVDIESYKRIHKDYKKALDIVRNERDTLINDISELRKERDELKQKFEDVVELFNTHPAYKKAWSDNPYYDKLRNELNRILEDE